MGLMDMFKFGAGQAQQPQGNPTATAGTPGNLPQGNPTMIAQGSPDGQIPGGNAVPQEQNKSPLAEFDKLWEPVKPAEGAIQDEPIKFNIDANRVRASAKQVDFTKTITPALLEKVNAGGEGALQAMLQVMNEMGQTIFAESMMAGTKVLENGLEASHQRVSRTLPDTIRKQNVGSALRENNPLFTNPATAPMLSALESQLQAKFPTASAAEITEHARNYLVNFANEAKKLDPATQAQTKFAAGREEDWSQVQVQ
jgi:hypothetical protein